MNSDVDLVAELQLRQVHQRRIENDPLGIADLRNRFCHHVILCFTAIIRNPFLPSGLSLLIFVISPLTAGSVIPMCLRRILFPGSSV